MSRIASCALGLAALICQLPHAVADVSFYVRPAPYGNDDWSGLSVSQAVATLATARDRVRAYRADSDLSPQDIIIHVGGGVYELPATLVLDAQDSGFDASNPLIFRAADLGDPGGADGIISGGTVVPTWTETGTPNVWVAAVSLTPTPEQPPRDLYRAAPGSYAEGLRLIRARYPNWNTADPYALSQWLRVSSNEALSSTLFRVTAQPGGTGTCFPTTAIPQNASYQDIGVELVARHRYVAPRQEVLVAGSPWTSTQVYTADRFGADPVTVSNIAIVANAEFYLEGADEWVDTQNEWAYTRPPAPGLDKIKLQWTLDPNDQTMIVPRLTTLMRLDRANYVSLEGLTFCYTNRPLLPQGYNPESSGHQAAAPLPSGVLKNDQLLGAAVEFTGTTGCILNGCVVSHTGGHGIVIQSHGINQAPWVLAQGNFVVGSSFVDMGGTGIYIGRLKNPYLVPNNTWPPIDLTARAHWVLETTVTGCSVMGYGAAYHDCAGIYVRKADETIISHNLVTSLNGLSNPLYSRYSGILGASFLKIDVAEMHALTVEYNEVHHVMSRLADGAGIYVQGYQPDSIIRGNWVHDMPRDPYNYANCLPNVGFYFDNGSAGFTIEQNLAELIGDYETAPTGCPTPPSCPGGVPASRIGTLQFNTKGACCLPINHADPKQKNPTTGLCTDACKSMAIPGLQYWPIDATKKNYFDHDFAALVEGHTVPSSAYSIFSQTNVPDPVVTIRQDAGP